MTTIMITLVMQRVIFWFIRPSQKLRETGYIYILKSYRFCLDITCAPPGACIYLMYGTVVLPTDNHLLRILSCENWDGSKKVEVNSSLIWGYNKCWVPMNQLGGRKENPFMWHWNLIVGWYLEFMKHFLSRWYYYEEYYLFHTLPKP